MALVPPRRPGARPAALPGTPSNGFLQMPTGAGKTLTTVEALAEVLAAGRPVLWIAHSSQLLDGAERTFRARYPELARGGGVRGIVPTLGRIDGRSKDIGARICLATVQTLNAVDQRALLAHLDQLSVPPVVIWDEFHHAPARSWHRILLQLNARGLPVLGLSATPMRGSVEGTIKLRRDFPEAVFRVGMPELIAARVLARPRIHTVRVEGERLTWTAAERDYLRKQHDVPSSLLNRLAAQAVRNKKILATYQSLAKDGLSTESSQLHRIRKCVIFCCSTDHAHHLAGLFQKAGIGAVDVCGEAKNPKNVAAIEKFKDEHSGLDVLTSVLLLAEGVDLPKCDTVMIARPTQSPVLLQQMIGRAMRGPEVQGTETCLVVDFVDNFENMHDVAATTVAFVRGLCEQVSSGSTSRSELDELLAQLDVGLRGTRTRSTRTPEQRRAAERAHATLLALRDYIWRHHDGAIDPSIVAQDISHMIHWIDPTSGLDRVFVVPRVEVDRFNASIRALASELGDLPPERRTPIHEATLARRAYDTHFEEGSRIDEDEYASAAAAALRGGASSGTTPAQPVAHVPAIRHVSLEDALASIHTTGLAQGLAKLPSRDQRYGQALLDLVSTMETIPTSEDHVLGDSNPTFIVRTEQREAWSKLPARSVLEDRMLFMYCLQRSGLSPGAVAQRASSVPRRRVGLVFPEVFRPR